jgi:hypothetical protein
MKTFCIAIPALGQSFRLIAFVIRGLDHVPCLQTCLSILLYWLLNTYNLLSLSLIFKWGSFFLIVYKRMLLVFRRQNINYVVLNPSESFRMIHIQCMIWYIFFNCSWVDTQWHLYRTHLHTNNTETTKLTTLVGRLSGIRTQSGETKINDELTT